MRLNREQVLLLKRSSEKNVSIDNKLISLWCTIKIERNLTDRMDSKQEQHNIYSTNGFYSKC